MLVVDLVVEKIMEIKSQEVLVEVVPVVLKDRVNPLQEEVNMLYQEQVLAAVAVVELMVQVQMLPPVETELVEE
tara:strand:- start:454 stop:675 length:222 start_codon:yes stop_codon:yes gene_type:complete